MNYNTFLQKSSCCPRERQEKFKLQEISPNENKRGKSFKTRVHFQISKVSLSFDLKVNNRKKNNNNKKKLLRRYFPDRERESIKAYFL